MGSKLIHVQLEISEKVCGQARALAEAKAHEAAVLALWQSGEVSTSRAAEELDLTVHAFHDLLSANGLAISRGFDAAAVDEATPKLSTPHPV